MTHLRFPGTAVKVTVTQTSPALCSPARGWAQQQGWGFPVSQRGTGTARAGRRGRPSGRQDGGSCRLRGGSRSDFTGSRFPCGESARGRGALSHANATRGLFYDSTQLLNRTKFVLAFYCGFIWGAALPAARGCPGSWTLPGAAGAPAAPVSLGRWVPRLQHGRGLWGHP